MSKLWKGILLLLQSLIRYGPTTIPFLSLLFRTQKYFVSWVQPKASVLDAQVSVFTFDISTSRCLLAVSAVTGL